MKQNIKSERKWFNMKIKNKWKIIYFIVITILLIVLGVILWSYHNRDEEVIIENNEIIPGEEISDEQLRNTAVSLYFINKETGEMEQESRLIDVKKLMNNPYEEIIRMWLAGSENANLVTACSKNVKLNSAKLDGNCVVIDLSKEFVGEYSGEKGQESKTIYSLVNSLTELTEVDCIKILIDGKEGEKLGGLSLSEKYFRLGE